MCAEIEMKVEFFQPKLILSLIAEAIPKILMSQNVGFKRVF